MAFLIILIINLVVSFYTGNRYFKKSLANTKSMKMINIGNEENDKTKEQLGVLERRKQ